MIETVPSSVGPGWTRAPWQPDPPPVVLTEIEQRRQVLAERERVANEERYRVLVFQYSERDLNDDEIVEIAALAEKLGLPSNAPDANRAAIRRAGKLQQIIGAPDPNFDSMRGEKNQARAAAENALCESVTDWLKETYDFDEMENLILKLQSENYVRRRGLPRPALPDRHVDDLLRDASAAEVRLSVALERRPNAEKELAEVHRQNPILWPEP
jgi:hypothetical protein